MDLHCRSYTSDRPYGGIIIDYLQAFWDGGFLIVVLIATDGDENILAKML